MATLVSPGTSVTITDESFFIPASAPTVPLIFIATADEKLRPDGITNAEGTFESEVVRAVTSLKQSTDLYGIPRFLEDSNGNQFHGDARNEYGLFALNQFLGVGNLAYVLRTNVNLNDDLDDLRSLWDSKIGAADILMQNLTQTFINEVNLQNGMTSASSGYQVVNLNNAAVGTNVAYSSAYIGNNLTASVDIDGTVFNVSTSGVIDGTETYNDVVALIQGAIGVAGTANITDGNIRVTSATTGINSTVSITDGDLDGKQIIDFGGTVVGTNTAYSGAYLGQVVTATIVIDGTSYPVTSGVAITGTETYNDMLNIVQTAIGAAGTINIINGDIVITSATTGTTSTVLITDGGPLSEFFGGMDGFVAFKTPVAGSTGTSLIGALNNFTGIDAPITYKNSVNKNEFLSLADEALTDVFSSFSFVSSETEFKGDWTSSPRDVFGNGFTNPPTGSFIGLLGEAEDWAANHAPNPLIGDDHPFGEWTPVEAGQTIVNAANDYKYTNEFFANTSLGSNDAARRVAIVTAFQASINGNTEIRSENFQYNLILCPGYPETVDELLNLAADIQDEALVIADTPMDKNPDGITNPTTGWAVTTERQNSTDVAYYYPHALASNLDGKNVLVAASGVALRTYAINDDTAFLWFAPAGLRRGLVTGVSGFGYASGVLGGPTTFEEVNLNQGQRDALYQDAPSGRINPLVFFPGSGFVVWGQKTSAPAPSAMDRVNVSRLIKYIKRSLRKNTLSFVFEPNDQLTRDNLKAVVDSFLGDLIIKRGLYDFATISDESNNTPDRIDRNEMYIDVALKPTKTAEFLFIPIRILTTGAEI